MAPHARPDAVAAWLPRSWEAEADRRPLWLPAGLGAGIGIYFALPLEPELGWAIAAAAAGLGLAPVCLGLLIAGFATLPDILIARNGRDVAVSCTPVSSAAYTSRTVSQQYSVIIRLVRMIHLNEENWVARTAPGDNGRRGG